MNKPRQYGGFSVYVSVTLTLVFIVIWVLTPPQVIHGTPLKELYEVLPQRYWLIAVECLVLMTMLFIYIGILAYNVDILTVPLHDIRTITDSQGSVAEYSNQKELEWYLKNETSGVVDLPMCAVSRVLYLQEPSIAS